MPILAVLVQSIAPKAIDVLLDWMTVVLLVACGAYVLARVGRFVLYLVVGMVVCALRARRLRSLRHLRAIR